MAAVEEGKGKGREEENSGSGDGSRNAAMVRLLLQTLYDLGYRYTEHLLQEYIFPTIPVKLPPAFQTLHA